MDTYLDRLGEPARRQIEMARRHWASATEAFVEFPRDALERSVTDRFERIAQTYADKVALESAEETLTYAELNRRANRVARTLVERLGTENEPVALLLEHGAQPVVAILGALKAGKIYVALDPAHPAARRRDLLQDSQARLIITDRRHCALAEKTAQSALANERPIEVLYLDELNAGASSENLGLAIKPDHFAALCYTSGSTGEPKGAIKSHLNIVHFAMAQTNAYCIHCDDRLSQFFSYCFARSMGPTFSALLNGATLLVCDLAAIGAGHLAEWLMHNRITLASLLPSLLRQLVEALPYADGPRLSKLRLVEVGGETTSRQDIELWKKHFAPNSILEHGLGSTEVAGIAHFLVAKETPIPGRVVPVGYPDVDVDLFVADADGSPVAPGQVGQIAVASPGAIPGYWRKPELTQQAFRTDPRGTGKRVFFSGDLGRVRADGALELVGRKDSQVKIRGYRVETGEVEAALLDLSEFKEAAVVARPDESGTQRLIAYLVVKTPPPPPVRELRGSLEQKLPEYSIPSVFVFLDALPRTPSRKVDRPALPEPVPTRPELGHSLIPPRNQTEAQLAKLWEDVLGIQPIGIQDSFFDLGGSSLDYFSLLTKIEKELGKELPTHAILQSRTIEQMALALDELNGGRPPTGSRDGLRRATLPAKRVAHLASTHQLWKGAERALTKQILLRGPAFGRVVLPYATGTRFLAWLCEQPWAVSGLLQRQAQLVRQCLALVPHPELSSDEEIVRRSLACNVWSRWRARALARCPSAEFERWVTVTGFEIFQRIAAEGRGSVIVSFHSAQAAAMKSVLRRAGLTDLASVRTPRENERLLHQAPDAILFASQLRECERAVRRGGIAIVAADGQMGASRGIERTFFGRRRIFRTGFAELAISTGVPAIPVSASMDREGHLRVEFAGPLRVPQSNRRGQVETLVAQYADLVHRWWTEDLAAVSWRQLEDFLQLPVVGAG